MKNSVLPKQKFLPTILAALILCTTLSSCYKTDSCLDRVHGRVITYSEEEGVPYVSERFLTEGIGMQDVEIILNKNNSTCCPLVNTVEQLDMTITDADGYFDFGDRTCSGSYRFVSRHGSAYLHEWYQIQQNHNNRHVLLYNYKPVVITFITSGNDLVPSELRYMLRHQNNDSKPFTKSSSSFRTLSMNPLSVSVMPNCNFKMDIKYKGVEQTHLFYSGNLEEDTIIDVTLIE